MTRLVVFQTPHDLWCFSCDESGTILDAFPENQRTRYIGVNIEEVSLIASSVLRYPVHEIQDNEYPVRLEILYNKEPYPEVKQSGLLLGFVEEWFWNELTNSLGIKKIG